MCRVNGCVCVCPLFMPQEKKHGVVKTHKNPSLFPPCSRRPSFCTSPSITHNRAPDREEIGIFIITHDRCLKKTTRRRNQTVLRTTQRAPLRKIKTRGIQVTVYREKRSQRSDNQLLFSSIRQPRMPRKDMIQADPANKRRMPANVQVMGPGNIICPDGEGKESRTKTSLSLWWWCGLFQSSYVLCMHVSCCCVRLETHARFSHPIGNVAGQENLSPGQGVKWCLASWEKWRIFRW